MPWTKRLNLRIGRDVFGVVLSFLAVADLYGGQSFTRQDLEFVQDAYWKLQKRYPNNHDLCQSDSVYLMRYILHRYPSFLPDFALLARAGAANVFRYLIDVLDWERHGNVNLYWMPSYYLNLALQSGSKELVKYLVEEKRLPFDSRSFGYAIGSHSPNLLAYLVDEQNYTAWLTDVRTAIDKSAPTSYVIQLIECCSLSASALLAHLKCERADIKLYLQRKAARERARELSLERALDRIDRVKRS